MSRACSVLLSLLAAFAIVPSRALAEAVAVEPSELTGRADLVGREVSVDDRVALFLFHQGKGFDEITLKRTPVVFRLPPSLRYSQSPGAAAARIQGVLRHEGDQWWCDVTSVELLPKDLERLERGVSALPAGESEKRSEWAAWARRRAKDFHDAALRDRAASIKADAIRIAAEKPSSDRPGHWLALARDARASGVPEPEPSALAHRAFRARFPSLQAVEPLRAYLGEVASFFPRATDPGPREAVDLAAWDVPYARDPAAAYRAASPEVRAALDRHLWADATERLLSRQAAADPKDAMTLAEQAATQLPERPAVAARLLEQGLKDASQQLGSMRLREVMALAQVYRQKLKQPARADALVKDWLDDQRAHHLSPTDAEGRVALAAQYENLVRDQETAERLLQDAWKIDPQSEDVADAFRRRGFRKEGDEWIRNPRLQARADAPAPASSPTPGSSSTGQSLRGKTPKEVRALLGGKPNRVVLSASQGQLLEQWIYFGTKTNQYVNFLHRFGAQVPTVVAYYTLPRVSSGVSAP